jgi:hypothetical protein
MWRRKRVLIPAAAIALLIAAASCGSTGDSFQDGYAAAQRDLQVSAVPTPAPAGEAPSPTSAAAATAEPAVTEWEMPDLVGMNLQDAQNTLQRHTDYGVPLSTSTDATGAGRSQLMDRNWQVCEQDPPAGTAITTGDTPDLTVVRTSESC